MSDAQIEPGRIRGVQTLDDVVEFLGDDLDWPIQAHHLEDVTFEYEPEELGIPTDQVPALKSLRQLRPLSASQPWGVFFVEFEGPRLPVTPLRRLLRSLVKKKRAGAESHPTWDLDDLLFVVATDAGDTIELHFVAFFDVEEGSSEIRTIPWRPTESPDQHIRRLEEELLPRLAWPDETSDTSSWRNTWRDAFRLRHGEAIGSAARLAERMAGTASFLRDHILEAITSEGPTGPFRTLLAEVRRELVSGVDEASFSDMCAQTLVYGMLTSRVTDPEAFGASPVFAAVPLANPFLAAFFEQVHQQVEEIESAEGSGLEQLIADLRESNVEAILDQFGATASGADPVIHFYEEFLSKYDSDRRLEAGAFYTPLPVVKFMVRAVDLVLRDRFGLPDGIADRSTWNEVSERIGTQVPKGVDPDDPFISMIDPATGTGTFLVEWMKQARESFLKSHDEAEWPDFLQESVLPGMHGFELMLAPYSIAHLKVALEAELPDGQLPDATVLLTDTLERMTATPSFQDLSDPVAAEGVRSEDLKRDGHFTVVIGNPPYDRVTKESSGGWVVHGDGSGGAMFDDVVKTATERTIFSHVASLYNLYAYFWRWAIWKAFEQHQGGPAVVSFITASSWLAAPGFVGLRELARDLCDEIWVLDLGGDNRGANPEENVFDIQSPVAIVVLARKAASDASQPAEVRYWRISGTRQEKLEALDHADGLNLRSRGWKEVPSERWNPFTPENGDSAWEGMPALRDLMPWQQPGCKLNRNWPVAPDHDTLNLRWRTFLESEDAARRSALFPDPTSGRTINTRVGSLPRLADLPADAEPQPIVRYQRRAFDRQWTFSDARLAGLERPSLWQAMGSRQVFMIVKSGDALGPGPTSLSTASVPDLDVFRGSFGGKDVIPLYRDAAGAKPNITEGLLDFLHKRLRLPETPVPEDLVAYVYVVLSTPAYQERFAEQLSDKVIRVPLTSDPALWDEAVQMGSELLWLHTFGERFSESERGSEVPVVDGIGWLQEPSAIPEAPADIVFDNSEMELHVGDGIVAGVSEDVWDYEVSGWQVVKKWCDHRTRRGRGRRGSELDEIRPSEWLAEWSKELIDLISVLSLSIDRQPAQQALLEQVLDGPLIDASSLPEPTPAERQVPETINLAGLGDEDTLALE